MNGKPKHLPIFSSCGPVAPRCGRGLTVNGGQTHWAFILQLQLKLHLPSQNALIADLQSVWLVKCLWRGESLCVLINNDEWWVYLGAHGGAELQIPWTGTICIPRAKHTEHPPTKLITAKRPGYDLASLWIYGLGWRDPVSTFTLITGVDDPLFTRTVYRKDKLPLYQLRPWSKITGW